MNKTALTLALAALTITTAACSPTAEEINGMTDDEAIEKCQTRITDKLTSPSSAVFPDKTELEIQKTGSNEEYWQIRGYVDSDNKFGASLRSDWYCQVTPREDGTFVVHTQVK
ncbi:hypothetical protein HMPREF1261_00484 [Corynebacterium sp. KPL1818]|uniref:hypothetical protein n=1 Tax=Corynebacterium sp. KPL1818 TaxID=1203559 RepID=UPI0003B89A61|nr:hypothetical protein [Corynebacterium sp. KPL1818]ERS60820.1 hypothetical protein HMPREF1261_00484 [Corynebacterium sp. KPL1818]